MPVSIVDRLRAERLSLSRLQKERASVLGHWERKLEQAQKIGLMPARIEELEGRLETAKAIFDRGILRAEVRIADFEAQLTAQDSEKQQKAQASLEPLKSKVRDAWLSNGGDPSKFDGTWEDMKSELIKQRTLDSLPVKPAQKRIPL